MDFCLLLNMGKNTGKNLSKNLSSKYSQKLFNHAKQAASDALKNSSKRAIEKTAKATGDLFGTKIAEKIWRTSLQNNSEKLTNEEKNVGLHREIPRESYTSPEKSQKVIDDLRLI